MNFKKIKVRYIVIAIVVILLLLFAWWWFFGGKVDKHYKIEGIISSEYNGTVVCMYDYFSEEKINEATVSKGKFVLKGEVDTAYLARLVNEGRVFDLMVEPGKDIKINFEDKTFVESSTLNNDLAQFQAMVKDYNLIIKNDSTGMSRDAFQSAVVTAMESHFNDMLGVYMLKEYLKLNPTEYELENVVNNFGTVVIDNPAIGEILKEYAATLEMEE